MSEMFNRDMLQVARAARGFTQGELAERAGVTQALISKLENGLTTDPSPETAQALCEALRLPPSFLYSNEKPLGLPPFHYRKRARLGAKVLGKIEAQINIRRIHLTRLLKSYEKEPHREFPSIDLVKNQWSPRDAAEHLRGYWMIPRGPVENLTEIAERGGAIVVSFNFDTALMDALSFRAPGLPPLIFMNSAVPGDRYRFSLAHEIAHLTLHNHPESDDEMEIQADEFAAELLMPAREIRPYLLKPSIGALARVKGYWKVSIKSLIVQAYRLKLITPNQYTGLNVNYSKAGYARHGEPFPIPVEKPSTLPNIIRHHLENLRYSIEDLAVLLMLSSEEVVEAYIERPRLRIVK
jgi:Zn-dependent peptidase ImmA (M78 family)/transcriptional regulator with XRE-family HTH domain